MSKTSFESMLKGLNIFPIFGLESKTFAFTKLDLSIDNPDIAHIDLSSSKALETYIWGLLKLNNARVAYGGYLECRGIYQRSNCFKTSEPENDRNIHLGLDLWIEAQTPVYAPLDGILHSFQNNTNYGDYGPTIILKHTINHTEFYTLYGHLSLESLKLKKEGAYIERGQQIAALGTAEVNGDYAPHLHFQIIKDLQGYYGDYPGVASASDLDYYELNCPDPNLLLKLK